MALHFSVSWHFEQHIFLALHKLQFALLNLTKVNKKLFHKIETKNVLCMARVHISFVHFVLQVSLSSHVLNCACNTRQTLELYAFGSFTEFQCLKFIQDINGPSD